MQDESSQFEFAGMCTDSAYVNPASVIVRVEPSTLTGGALIADSDMSTSHADKLTALIQMAESLGMKVVKTQEVRWMHAIVYP